MKRAVLLLLSLLLPLSVALAQSQNTKTRVGVIIPLSGTDADDGSHLKNGAELAKSELPPGARDQIELLFQDDQSNPSQALGALTRLTTSLNADVVVTYGSGAAKAVMQLAERKQIPTFTMTPLSDITNGMKYILRHHLDVKQEVDIIKVEMNRRKLKRLFVVWTKTDFVTEQVTALKSTLGDLIRDEYAHTSGDSDFSRTIEEIKDANADSVLLALEPGQFAKFAQEAMTKKLGVPVLTFSTVENLHDIAAAGKAMEGYVYSGAQASEMFLQKYVKRFGRPPSAAAANIYDIIRIIGLGAEKHGSDRDALNNFFHTAKNVGGVLGVYTAKNGFLSVPPYLKEIRNGQFRLFMSEQGTPITPLQEETVDGTTAPEVAADDSSSGDEAASSGVMKKVLIFFLLAVVCTAVVLGIYWYTSTRDQTKVQDMVHGLLSASGISERLTKSRLVSDEELDVLKKTSRAQKQKQNQLQTAIFGPDATTSLSDKLFRAGIFTKEERHRYERRQIVFPVVGFVIGLIAAFSIGAMLWVILIAPILGLALGWQLPSSLLDRQISKRQDETLYYLPLVIEQISIGVSSSLDIWPCISNILDMAKVRNTLNPVTELFLYVEKLVASGLGLQDALDEVGVACGVTQVQMAFKFLGQCAEHGGEVSKQLQDLANAVMRERQTQIEAKIAALPVKATGPLFLVFAGFFILMLAGIFTRLLTSLKLE